MIIMRYENMPKPDGFRLYDKEGKYIGRYWMDGTCPPGMAFDWTLWMKTYEERYVTPEPDWLVDPDTPTPEEVRMYRIMLIWIKRLLNGKCRFVQGDQR